MIQAIYESQQQTLNSNPNSNGNSVCVLSSPYIHALFTFRDLFKPSLNSYNSFPINRPDEYSLYFANYAPESEVSMSVRTEMYNARPDGSRDFLSVGQVKCPSLRSTSYLLLSTPSSLLKHKTTLKCCLEEASLLGKFPSY